MVVNPKRDFSNVLHETVETTRRQEEETDLILPADANSEIFHIQADGFYGFEKGFHDAEQLWKQQRPA